MVLFLSCVCLFDGRGREDGGEWVFFIKYYFVRSFTSRGETNEMVIILWGTQVKMTVILKP
jgi:hypothetical protein